MLFVVDAVATSAITLLAVTVIARAVQTADGFGEKSFIKFLESEHEVIFQPSMGIFEIASFFTSIWVWLYVLASVAIRLLHGARFIWVKIVPFLNIEKKPMDAIGRVAGIIAGICYGVVLAGVWLYQHL